MSELKDFTLVVDRIEELKRENTRLRAEIEACKAELAQAQECCAEMRQRLEPMRGWPDCTWRIEKALSSTCGNALLEELNRGIG